MIQEAMLKTWALEKDVLIGEVTRHALEAGCDRMLLVCRQVLKKRWDYCSPQAAEVAGKLLAPYSLKTLTTTAWPGTVLKKEADGHQAKVFIYRFGPSLAQVLSGIGPMLFDWKHGGRHDLPEDLCLWRDGEALPLFFSTTHERMAWWLGPHAWVHPLMRREELESAFIPRTKFFCVAK